MPLVVVGVYKHTFRGLGMLIGFAYLVTNTDMCKRGVEIQFTLYTPHYRVNIN